MNRRIKEIKKEINELKRAIAKVYIRLEEAHKERFLTCELCHKKSKVKNCDGIELNYWDSNTGSPCGGFYSHGYYAWECPKCGCYISHEMDDELYYEIFQSFKNTRVINAKGH
jgi:hypothetical protein